MRGVLVTALAAFLAVFVFAGSKPASALPATAALDYSHTNADLVEVKKYKYNKRYKYNRGRYYRGPRYRPYAYPYRPYRYRPYRPYYAPYYRRRSGVSIWW